MKRLLNIIYVIVLILGIIIIILNLSGFKTYRVISDSMSPTIYKNALAIVKDYDGDKPLKEEDIIAYVVNDKLVLHRIKEIDGKVITTKGDANESYDLPIDFNDVLGVYVFSIPFVGILFASIYPWIIIILLVVGYIIIKQTIKELKKDCGEK